MVTATEIETLKAVIKDSKANIKILDYANDRDTALEYPQDDLVYIQMANLRRSEVEIIPSHHAVMRAYGDSTFRQIVLNVQEPARQIERNVTFSSYFPTGKSSKAILKEAKDALEKGRNFGLGLPRGTKYEVVGDLKIDNVQIPNGRVEGKVKATIPKSNTHFLIGHDENAMFVSVLPKAVRSVTGAHDALRPKGVPKDALRQGEFFFVPASARTSAALDKKITSDAGRLAYGNLGQFLDENESHAAQTLESYGRNDYVLGFIADVDGRHVPLFLDEWHKVVINLEVEPPGHMDGVGSWD